MIDLHDFDDIHTHSAANARGSRFILNIEPEQQPDDRGYYSVGVHPWRADEAHTLWPLVEQAARHSHVVAIGECGLDALRGPAADVQRQLFERHIRLSEAVGKPLVIHAVRSWPQLIELRKRFKPTQEWIIHGFRGKPQLAKELLRHGFSLSFGPQCNSEAFWLTPPSRRYLESDAEAE